MGGSPASMSLGASIGDMKGSLVASPSLKHFVSSSMSSSNSVGDSWSCSCGFCLKQTGIWKLKYILKIDSVPQITNLAKLNISSVLPQQTVLHCRIFAGEVFFMGLAKFQLVRGERKREPS